MLELDYTNILESAVGDNGISEGSLGRAAATSGEWITALEVMRKSGNLGFAGLPEDDAAVAAVEDFARSHAFPDILVLGIGGSALGPGAIEAALARPNSGKRLIVLDNIDPDFIRDSLATLDPKDTLVNVIAKSGVTAETMATLAVVREWMAGSLGGAARDHFVATTDPEKGDLLCIARDEQWPVFQIPPGVGGRFSVLTPVGTLPAALLGFDVQALMEGARSGADRARRPFFENPAVIAAYIQFVLDREKGKRILVLFPYSQSLWKFAFWFKQLWGESLGKKTDRKGREVYTGQTPTAVLGVTDQHSQLQLFIEGPNDKSFVFWSVREHRDNVRIEHPFDRYSSMQYLNGKTLADLFRAEKRATEMALTEAGRPNVTVGVERVDEAHIGELFMFSEYQTAYCGELYDISAFDQPGVEYGKKLTFAMMERAGYEDYARKIEQIGRRQRKIVP